MSEKIDKACGQFQLKAVELFNNFDKYGMKEERDGAVSELKILIKQLKRRLNGEKVVIATPRQMMYMNERPDD
jgi:hypothetical protein